MKLFKPQDQIVHYSQRNNFWNPSGACFPTTVAMALRNNHLPEKHHWLCIDDVIAMFCNTPGVGGAFAKKNNISGGNLNTWWTVEEYVAKYILFHLQSEKPMEEMKKYVRFVLLTLDEIKQEIERGYGVVTSIFMRTKNTNIKAGGHILFCVGCDDSNEEMIFCDPYGNWNTWYKDANGFLVRYSYQNCIDFLKGDGAKKYALLIHSDLKNPIV